MLLFYFFLIPTTVLFYSNVKCHCPWRRTSILLPIATPNSLPIVLKPPFGWPIVATFVEEKSIRRVVVAVVDAVGVDDIAAVGVRWVGVGAVLFRCRPTIVVDVIFSFFLHAQIQVSHNIFCDLPMRVHW